MNPKFEVTIFLNFEKVVTCDMRYGDGQWQWQLLPYRIGCRLLLVTLSVNKV
jgi:hypothetical protein